MLRALKTKKNGMDLSDFLQEPQMGNHRRLHRGLAGLSSAHMRSERNGDYVVEIARRGTPSLVGTTTDEVCAVSCLTGG